ARPLLGALGVDVLPDPHPPKSVAALDADAPVRRFVHEIADRTDDLPLFMVDAHGVIDGNRGSTFRCPREPCHAETRRRGEKQLRVSAAPREKVSLSYASPPTCRTPRVSPRRRSSGGRSGCRACVGHRGTTTAPHPSH